jgi:hypothetical protein
MNDADAHRLRIAWARELDGLAVIENLARIARIDARENFHQRRLAGAVLAHQRVDFARHEFELDLVQRPYTRKALAKLIDGNERCHGAELPTNG